MSASVEQLLEAVAGLVVVGVVGDDRDAQPRQPPPQRPADGAQAHQACGSPGDFAAAEPLIGDGAVAKHLAGPDIGVGGQQVAGGREQQRDGHLGDGVGIAARRVQNRDPRRPLRRQCRRCWDHRGWTRSPAAGARTPARRPNRIPPQQHRRLLRWHARPAARRCRSATASCRSTGRRPHRPAGAACRNPARAAGPSPGHAVSGSRLPMLAYGDARVTRRGDNRHRYRHDRGQGGGRRRARPSSRTDPNPAPAADTGTGQPRARRRAGVAEAARWRPSVSWAAPTPRAVAVSAMVPSLTAVDPDGIPVTPGPAVRRQPGQGRAPTAGMGFMVARRRSSCGGRRGKHPPPRATGRRPRWPTMRWGASR